MLDQEWKAADLYLIFNGSPELFLQTVLEVISIPWPSSYIKSTVLQFIFFLKSGHYGAIDF